MRISGFIAAAILIAGCTQKPAPIVVLEEVPIVAHGDSIAKPLLSDWKFFNGQLRKLVPAKGVFPYDINAPLFSDYAFKKRFIALPAGTTMSYKSDDIFDFPIGTTLIKNFYYPIDFRNPDGAYRILETRLLHHDSTGWRALPYIWNKEQTEAYLERAGGNLAVEWIHYDGTNKKLNYSIPNENQCKSCHQRGDNISPIGLLARQLNRGDNGQMDQNQLTHWRDLHLLTGLPSNPQSIPLLVSYDDSSKAVGLRARAWLEVNCAHCHREDGSARNSGLHLLSTVGIGELGIGKAPVAAGKGTGGRLYAIVPGKPDESILQFRIESTEPGIMMPEMGRKLRHEEGIKLIREWIEGLASK